MSKPRTKAQRTQTFSATLLALMERNGINQVDISAATGIAVSRINNYLHGKYRTIRPDHLKQLADAAARTAEERGELIRAYILDLLPEVMQAEIGIEMIAEAGKRSKPARAHPVSLPSATSGALADLQILSTRNAKARARTEWFAEILREAHGALK